MNTVTLQTKVPSQLQLQTSVPDAIMLGLKLSTGIQIQAGIPTASLQGGGMAGAFPYTFPFDFNQIIVESITLRGH